MSKEEQQLQHLKGSTLVSSIISKKEAEALEKFGIFTLIDLLSHFPKRYEDRRRFDAFPSQAGGDPVCIRGTIIEAKRSGFGGSRSYFEIIAVANSTDIFTGGKIHGRWFNMPYIQKILAAGQELILFGKVKDVAGKLTIDHPEFEIINEEDKESTHLERIVPIYRLKSGLNQRALRETIQRVLSTIDTASIEAEYDVDSTFPRIDAFKEMHFPSSLEAQEAAYRYFALEEFFQIQLSVAYRRHHYRKQSGYSMGKKKSLLTKFYKNLPFDLTDAQKRCVKEIAEDMIAKKPMNRLLQGDVGSGKTFVALCAALLAVESGYQVALMAPTQILAGQHLISFKKWLDPLGIKIGLLTGNRKEDLDDAQILVGTHALIFNDNVFSKLGLVIVDEQHKFGVSQRAKLIDKGTAPDVLVMTATPIPRTLTLTIYGDLDVSIINELPANRGAIITGLRVKPKISDVTSFVKDQLKKGRQAYIVYPLVEESEVLQAQSATAEFEKWSKRLSKYSVGLLHGKMPPEQKDQVMEGYRSGDINVLVATSVIEVGVDVPNASLMIIFNAERFGLAQLHQLRGRIGRGEHKSYCILVTDGKSQTGTEKLEILASTGDGFKIAEADLNFRGPGDVLGTYQSGLSEMKFAEALTDLELIKQARHMSNLLIKSNPSLSSYPLLLQQMDFQQELD